MSNTHFLKNAAVSALMLGMVIVLGTSGTILQGKLSGQEMLLPAHNAAPAAVPLLAEAKSQLLIGMMLMLLGFLLYSLMHVRTKNGERRVRVHAVKRSFDVPLRVQRRKPGYYWMEIRI